MLFYITGDLTSPGTDKQPPMTAAGKQRCFWRSETGREVRPVALH